MTAKLGKPNLLSAFRGFEKGGAAAPHLSVSLRKLRETPPSRPENRGGGTPISRPGRLSHCYNSSAHRPRSLFELQDVGSVATNAVKPHLNHPSILLSDGLRSLPERGFSTDTQVPKDRHRTTVLQPAKRRLFAISELGNGGDTVSEVSFYESEGEVLSKRGIWLKVRVTDKEREIIKRKAARLGMTVSEYVRTALIHSDNHPSARKVRCVETGRLFTSLGDAARTLGLKSGNSIKRAIDRCGTSGGYHWEYVDD
jgi:hypothetical protein